MSDWKWRNEIAKEYGISVKWLKTKMRECPELDSLQRVRKFNPGQVQLIRQALGPPQRNNKP